MQAAMDKISEMDERIHAIKAERDAYAAHCATLIDQRNEVLNAARLERELVDRMCLGFTAARSALRVWASSCGCSACQTLATHARQPE